MSAVPRMDSTTSHEDFDSLESSRRRERAAIAAQACQTCRNRKSKCDERRPKCGLCTRLNVECTYREPLPTKKDKTMVQILETLTRLENKFDSMVSSELGSQADGSANKKQSQPSSTVSLSAKTGISNHDAPQNFPTDLRVGYKHVTVPHKVILWPTIYKHLASTGINTISDLQHVLEDGTHWFIKQEIKKHPDPLPYDLVLPYFAINSSLREQGFSSRVGFPTLSIQQIQEQCDAYFNTYNVLFPILNRDVFMNDTVAPLLRDGYGDGDSRSVLALLVFALGQVAIEGVYERPISLIDGQASGFRGGTVERPPGLAIFNEARRRIGFVATQSSLENVQILLLEAIYYEASARHLDFWRSTVAASMACQVLIKCKNIDWFTPAGDLVKRAYWTCVLSEDFYHFELDLPKTGIDSLEDDVPLPHFHDADTYEHQGARRDMPEEHTHFKFHFSAMIALRKLIVNIHSSMQESTLAGEAAEQYGGPPVHVIRELARQLDSWRLTLPWALQWTESDRFDFPHTNNVGRRSNEPLYSPDQGSLPVGHKFNLDVVTAQLRTRFYYARFSMYRPFVYKALHFPELMTPDDVNCCALAIASACLWPISMASPKNKKRLVPHLFAWTQNFMAILLILRMTTENPCLRHICDTHVSCDDIKETVALMLEWLKDVKQLDGVAEWSWGVLEPLYSTRGV